MSDRETTKDLLERLQRHYIKPGPLPGGVFVPECGINGGAQTRADALYVGFTSASGRILIGHELKVSRADWRKELDTAGKADFWADNCHAWYIVAPSLDIVPKEEVPHGWGLMIPNSRTRTRMDIAVKATVHADRHPAWEATRSILARLDTLRAQHDYAVEKAAQEKARKRAEEDIERARAARAQQALTPEQSLRLRQLDRIEEVLGTSIISYFDADADPIDPATAAAALRLCREAKAITFDTDRYSAQRLERAADQLLKGLVDYNDALETLLTLTGARP